MRITPNILIKLAPNEVFVFGSNTEGRHSKGAALTARLKFKAQYGNPKGLQGQSYAIITKDLKKGERSIPLSKIEEQIEEFIEFAKNHPDLLFYVTKLGCSLAGYSVEEIAPLFKNAINVENITLPLEFWRILDENHN